MSIQYAFFQETERVLLPLATLSHPINPFNWLQASQSIIAFGPYQYIYIWLLPVCLPVYMQCMQRVHSKKKKFSLRRNLQQNQSTRL